MFDWKHFTAFEIKKNEIICQVYIIICVCSIMRSSVNDYDEYFPSNNYTCKKKGGMSK